jgi:transcriptional regulator with XRE-family HTH domain
VTLAAAVADEVQRRARSRGLSQNALARAAGMPPTLLHRAMQGRRQLQLDELERLAPALGVSAVWLIRAAASTGTPRSGDVQNRTGASASD